MLIPCVMKMLIYALFSPVPVRDALPLLRDITSLLIPKMIDNAGRINEHACANQEAGIVLSYIFINVSVSKGRVDSFTSILIFALALACSYRHLSVFPIKEAK